jgi:hypothetical protein
MIQCLHMKRIFQLSRALLNKMNDKREALLLFVEYVKEKNGVLSQE